MIRDRICKKCLKWVPYAGTTTIGEHCRCAEPDVKTEEEIYYQNFNKKMRQVYGTR